MTPEKTQFLQPFDLSPRHAGLQGEIEIVQRLEVAASDCAVRIDFGRYTELSPRSTNLKHRLRLRENRCPRRQSADVHQEKTIAENSRMSARSLVVASA